VVDIERAGDVLTLTFATGKKAVVNTQRPTRQIWLAANARAWHFSYEEPAGTSAGRWMDDKGQGAELITQIAAIVKELAGLDLAPPA
jgi:CyaY protein